MFAGQSKGKKIRKPYWKPGEYIVYISNMVKWIDNNGQDYEDYNALILDDSWEEYKEDKVVLSESGDIQSQNIFTEKGIECVKVRGLLFDSIEEAQLFDAQRILLKKISDFREKKNGGWKPSWNCGDQFNWCIEAHANEVLTVVDATISNGFNIFGNFKLQAMAQECIELFGEEIMQLFVKKEV